MPIAVGFLSLRAQECLGYHQAHKGSSPGISLSKPSGAHGFGVGGGGGLLWVRYHTWILSLPYSQIHILWIFTLPSHPLASLFHSSALSPSHFPWQRLCPFQNERLFPHLGDTKEQGIFWYHGSHKEPLILWNAGPLLQMCFLLKLLVWFLFLGETSMRVC